MNIVAGGDSFVYGSELKDCIRAHSHSTFPALLAHNNKHNYRCTAWPGMGNDSIARRVIKECYVHEIHHDTDNFVFVNWTFPSRYEFRFNYDTGQRTGHWYGITPHTADQKLENHIARMQSEHIARARNLGMGEFAESFYKHVGGDYWDVYTSLKEIVHLQNFCIANKLKFMFTCADNSILYNKLIHNSSNRAMTMCDDNINMLVKQIKDKEKHWFWFPDGESGPRGFYQWAMENKYPSGATHPLEEAHEAAYQLMKDKFNELVKEPLE